MIKFSHIAPKSCMAEAMAESGIHMALFHLINDNNYVEHFREAQREVILDNSFYELGTCPPVAELIRAGHKINADYIVLPDGELDGIDEVKAAGFKVMAIPAGPDMAEQFTSAMDDDNIDLVGLSFYHARLAIGSDNKYDSGARFNFLQTVGPTADMKKKVHILGMGDTAHEIPLLRAYWHIIHSWDSSVAVWSGLNGMDIRFSRMKHGGPVNFDSLMQFDDQCNENIQYVNSLLDV